jgi:hypothetical protein
MVKRADKLDDATLENDISVSRFQLGGENDQYT